MGAPVELERWYDEHAQALFAFLLSLTRNEADTRDLLQDIFVKLACRPELLRNAREPRSFLLRLAHNAAVDLLRRRGVREKTAQSLANESIEMFDSDAGSEPDEEAFQRALADAMGELPADQRAVVHLKLWENLTFEQISDLLEIPLNTAGSRYRYGIDKLRNRLRPLYDEIK